MTPEEYRENRRRTTPRDIDIVDQKLNAALGLGESGELQNIIKKEIFQYHETDSVDVLDEAGDMLFYIDWILDSYDWTLDDAMQYNVNKLRRRYPNGFEAERSINREV